VSFVAIIGGIIFLLGEGILNYEKKGEKKISVGYLL
jgi:hypothetical protein